MAHGELEALIAQLSAHAALPDGKAALLPAETYVDPRVLQLERRRIFASEWLCVGRTADIPSAGDHILRDIPSAHDDSLLSVIVARGDDNVVRAFTNVCAHRCATLVTADGNSSRLACPYHAWVYRLDGQCVSAPYMQHAREADGTPFDPANHQLHELRLTQWEGFLYVSQAPDPPPLAPRLGGLTDVMRRYRMAGYVTVAGGTDEWVTNWKCLAENFLDAYHVFKVHRNTFARESDSTATTTVHPGGEGYTYHVAVDDPASEYGVAHPTNDVLDGAWRHSTVLAITYPTHVVQLQPDWLWYLVLSPLGPGRVHIRWSAAVAPEIWTVMAAAERATYLGRIVALIDAVNAEDRPVIEGVWTALQHRQPVRAPFSHLEKNVFDIGRYVSARLTQSDLH